MSERCYTITFGDCCENHVGMQKLGKTAANGFSCKDLKRCYNKFVEEGYECKIYHLNKLLPIDIRNDTEQADILVVRKFLTRKEEKKLLKELDVLSLDKKYYDTRRKKVLNKNARWNCCFADEYQKPDYESEQGTVYAFSDVPTIQTIREDLPFYLKGSKNLLAELNYYYDINKCGIGWHGDTERRKVVGVRVGDSSSGKLKGIPLCYCWSHQAKPIGDILELTINSRDLYIMSEKAGGYDWKIRRKGYYSIRHSAGADKYTVNSGFVNK